MEGPFVLYMRMEIKNTIQEIRLQLQETFAQVDAWFAVPDNVSSYMPVNNGWTIVQVLEHISITNHFLLLLIERGAEKALRRAKTEDLNAVLKEYSFNKTALDEIGLHQSFPWMRPEHMEPRGAKDKDEVRELLKIQLQQCLDVLARLPNGEGVLCKTTMSVNNLGKIDVYEYISFLGLHARRHITQMRKIENEYLDNKT